MSLTGVCFGSGGYRYRNVSGIRQTYGSSGLSSLLRTLWLGESAALHPVTSVTAPGRSMPPETTRFLNVDLDIHSSSNLEPLVAGLGRQVTVLHLGRVRRTHVARLELSNVPTSADSAIHTLCALIKSLSAVERNLWDTALVRDFNIGVQAEARAASFELAIAVETIKAASDLNARVVLTVYAPVVERNRKGAHARRLVLSTSRTARRWRSDSGSR